MIRMEQEQLINLYTTLQDKLLKCKIALGGDDICIEVLYDDIKDIRLGLHR